MRLCVHAQRSERARGGLPDACRVPAAAPQDASHDLSLEHCVSFRHASPLLDTGWAWPVQGRRVYTCVCMCVRGGGAGGCGGGPQPQACRAGRPAPHSGAQAALTESSCPGEAPGSPRGIRCLCLNSTDQRDPPAHPPNPFSAAPGSISP